MGSVSKRLQRLEGPSKERAYVDVLRRMLEGKEPGEEDGPILTRIENLSEEARHEH